MPQNGNTMPPMPPETEFASVSFDVEGTYDLGHGYAVSEVAEGTPVTAADIISSEKAQAAAIDAERRAYAQSLRGVGERLRLFRESASS